MCVKLVVVSTETKIFLTSSSFFFSVYWSGLFYSSWGMSLRAGPSVELVCSSVRVPRWRKWVVTYRSLWLASKPFPFYLSLTQSIFFRYLGFCSLGIKPFSRLNCSCFTDRSLSAGLMNSIFSKDICNTSLSLAFRVDSPVPRESEKISESYTDNISVNNILQLLLAQTRAHLYRNSLSHTHGAVATPRRQSFYW